MVRPLTFVLALAVVYVATFLVADRLRFEPVKDEIHLLESARLFASDFDSEDLRTYPEVVTPLALVLWGQLERVTGAGLWAGRCLNLCLSFGLVCGVALFRPSAWPRGALAAVGLLAFPYTLPLSVHLYTDILASALAGLGTVAVLRRRSALAFVAFTAAIATRQYLVQVPAALAAAEALAWWRGAPERWRNVVACAAASGTLGGWILFFGGLAPRAGLDAWIPRYPAPMLEASAFILHYGLYALTGIGLYFAVFEAILFRQLPDRRALLGVRPAVVAGVLAILFALDPPLLTASHPGGPLGRVARVLLPAPQLDGVRLALFYGLALLAALRFSRRLDASFWIVLTGAVLATKQQIPWEKYLLPTLSSLWILRVAEAAPYGDRARTESTSNAWTKQSSPSSRLST